MITQEVLEAIKSSKQVRRVGSLEWEQYNLGNTYTGFVWMGDLIEKEWEIQPEEPKDTDE